MILTFTKQKPFSIFPTSNLKKNQRNWDTIFIFLERSYQLGIYEIYFIIFRPKVWANFDWFESLKIQINYKTRFGTLLGG
jgi:hypothetical protein